MPSPCEKRAAVPSVDVIVESGLWDEQPDADRIIRDAIVMAAQETCAKSGEVAVMLIGDGAMSALNGQWRGMSKPTNVLSFPAAEMPGGETGSHIGDIAIAYETLASEAASEEKPFAHHLAHLAVHGYLHLLGYDHEDMAQAEAMENLERVILAKLGIPDPYMPREAETLRTHA